MATLGKREEFTHRRTSLITSWTRPAPPPCRAVARCWPVCCSSAWRCSAGSASRWHVIWPDTVDYLRVSQALERGDPRPLAEQFGLNVYPPILVLLHGAGLDWLWAGQCWSIAMTALTVLPLFGWLRRQFDQQVAVVGCLLYAVHPKLMIHGPLVIRDPTFWFLLVLTLYLGWRAVLELKPWLFLAAGVAWALAAHTRTEGLLLAAPLGLWWFFRWFAVAGQRRRGWSSGGCWARPCCRPRAS